MVEWTLNNNHGEDCLCHYLDDFLALWPESRIYLNNLCTCLQLCSDLGLPLHPDKLEGPATSLTILALLDSWSSKRFCKRKELESLIGHLPHACKIAPLGRTFLPWMINLPCTFRHNDHPIRFNQTMYFMVAAPFPILEWPEFLPYNGVGSPTRLFIRRSRILGLWGILSGPFVLWLVVSFAGPIVL